MGRSLTKAESLLEMERLYLLRPYSDNEMAEHLGVNRSTAYRYRTELSTGENGLPIEQDADGRWKIDRARHLSNVRVNLYESLSLYLAARRATQQSRLAGEHAAHALEKISLALYQPVTGRLVKAADRVLAAQTDPARVKVFETVARGWAEQIPVRIHYRALHVETARPHLIHPYLIEPAAWSDSVYLIAHSETDGIIIPFKIERIERAALSTGHFEIPASFDEDEMLKHAWGIWARAGEPQTVRLKFAPGAAARRVQESTWHPLEKVTVHDDGAVTWEAPIADWREMLPWVRGWGADCEVLGPEGLRKTLQNEVNRLARVYGVSMRPPLYALWAKTDRASEHMHPLIYHAIDVGECARLLWEHGLTPGIRTRVAADLGCSEAEAGSLFAFLAALHDIGKASPAYQMRYPPYANALNDLHTLGFDFPPTRIEHPVPHGIVSAHVLKSLLAAIQDDAYVTRRLAHAVGGHHGLWPDTLSVQGMGDKNRSQAGSGLWETTRARLFETLRACYQPPVNFAFPDDAAAQNRLLTLLSGFVTAADWLGSMQEYFDYEESILPPETYRQQAAAKAQKALAETGWLDTWQPEGTAQPFEKLFPFSPNEIQQTVIARARTAEQPALVILEAPTGIGKTEAALYLADAWLQEHGGRGLYIAMPTQATSNQMFTRTLGFLEKHYPGQPVNVHLAHGQALWHEDMQRLRMKAIGDEPDDGLRAEAWFTPRKRTLLAPFAVGTVDQALLGVLQSRHFFLRLFGLAHKVVIFDEVHAYDTYMEALFLRLLTWLRAIGTSVIVLSATLPRQTRHEMAAAWGRPLPDDEQTPYPRLTLVTPQSAESIPLPQPAERVIRLAQISQSPEAIAGLLAEKLPAGGCAAVLCNTVRRAQDVYQALAAHFPPEERMLFHARTPFKWRKDTEEQVLAQFGKNGKRPQRAVVVATQVIEQSLDLDFDLLVSDLAPIDLLIQRAGRLHRHPRPARPAALEQATLWLALPEGTLEAPNFGTHAFIYEPYILWQTWRTLADRPELRLPTETDALIQAVYAPFNAAETPAVLHTGLKEAWENLQKHFREAAYQAESGLVPAPGDTDRLVTQPFKNLRDDEDPALHPSARARTRLIAPGVQIVCLHRQPDGSLNLEPDGSGENFPAEAPPPREKIKSVLEYTLTLHDRRLVRCLAGTESPWRSQSALRYVFPLVFENGLCTLDDLTLSIDHTLGFRILSD
ncbi:MAG: hypothetical protein Fur0018_25970 [Anaerolineales bacterium]